MEKTVRTKTGREFRPAPQFKSLYYIYFVLVLIFAVFTWYVPVLVFAPLLASLVVSAFVLPVLIFTVYWISKYYDSIRYKLTGSEMEWRRGVWFKQTGIVPYNRITNVDISQGPVSRSLGIAALKIQTAGYSAPSSGYGRSSEIKIEGVERFEELREYIMAFVRGRRPVAVETYDYEEEETGKPGEDRVLNELVKIRKVLEKQRKK